VHDRFVPTTTSLPPVPSLARSGSQGLSKREWTLPLFVASIVSLSALLALKDSVNNHVYIHRRVLTPYGFR
jgi:hypothetical protein